MDDDPDFMKDVLGQRMKNMIKDEVRLNVEPRYMTLSNYLFFIRIYIYLCVMCQSNCSVGSLEMLESSIVIVITTDSRIMTRILLLLSSRQEEKKNNYYGDLKIN